MGKNICNYIDEIHLYKNKKEAIIKVPILMFSWIAGIITMQDVTDKRSLASAYFIFSLSFLMEFSAQIEKKKTIVGKISHTIFCLSCLAMLFMSFGVLVNIVVDTVYYDRLFFFSIVAVAYMGIDFILLWIFHNDFVENTLDSDESKKKINQNNEVKAFEESLKGGKLGNTEGEN